MTDRPVVAAVVRNGASPPPGLEAVAEAADVYLTGTAADLAAILPAAEVIVVYDSAGWQQTLGALFVENFQRWQRGGELLNVVDKEQLLAAEQTP